MLAAVHMTDQVVTRIHALDLRNGPSLRCKATLLSAVVIGLFALSGCSIDVISPMTAASVPASGVVYEIDAVTNVDRSRDTVQRAAPDAPYVNGRDLDRLLDEMVSDSDFKTDGLWHDADEPSWTAVSTPGDQEQIDSGQLVQWADRYYAAHAWTMYGRWALDADIGDTVVIDGKRLQVVRVFTLSGDTTVEDVRENAENGTYVMQTCEDETNRWHRHLVMTQTE